MPERDREVKVVSKQIRIKEQNGEAGNDFLKANPFNLLHLMVMKWKPRERSKFIT